MFAYGKDPNKSMLTSHIPSRGKNILLATFHDTDELDIKSGDEHKPYEYSVTRVSNRFAIDSLLLNAKHWSVNSRIIYTRTQEIMFLEDNHLASWRNSLLNRIY